MNNVYSSTPLRRGVSREIRLAKFSRETRADGTTMISCTLFVAELGAIPFTALSYVWGEPGTTRSILVNGKTTVIRETLWQFLTLGSPSFPNDLFWIDALCIDQTNIEERSHQVSIMGRIYSGASKVVVWLGKDLDDIPSDEEEDLQSIKSIYRRRQGVEYRGTTTEARAEQSAAMLRDMHKVLDSLQALVSNAYWNRTWIAQEYILAKETIVTSGTCHLNGDVLSRMCQMVMQWQHDRQPFRAKTSDERLGLEIIEYKTQRIRKSLAMDIMIERDVEQGRGNKWEGLSSSRLSNHRSLERLLGLFAESDCAEPRDHVYALLSLISKEDLKYFNLAPNYFISKEKLFLNLAYGYCRREGLEEGRAIMKPLTGALYLRGQLDIGKLFMTIKDDLESGGRAPVNRQTYQASGPRIRFAGAGGGPDCRDGG